MAPRSPLTLAGLTALGAEKLAQLIMDEAAESPAFARRVKAALAGGQGPTAVAKLIDRRLSALDRAKAMVPWEKERALAADLDALVDSIERELAPLSPLMAAQRLIRFIGGHGSLFNRIDDSSGRIQAVYWRAAEILPRIVEQMGGPDHASLPGLLDEALTRDSHGLIPALAIATAPLLPPAILADWEKGLSKATQDKYGQIIQIRQAIAEAMGNLDHYIALEARLPEHRRDPLRIAAKLLEAKRAGEVLEWVRKAAPRTIPRDLSDDFYEAGVAPRADREQVKLEARILEVLGNRAEAQTLRWSQFTQSLDAALLRDYIAKLEDFNDREETARALAHVAASPYFSSALQFCLDWPALDLASDLVVARPAVWSGRHYALLVPAAEALADQHPLAASVLYRALLDDILARAKSPAYGHGAKYLGHLDRLAQQITDWQSLPDHVRYREQIKKAHGRKLGFWSLVK
ncbi:MAG: hypothetical protein JHC88_03900 [Niveispirillum sp.]|nr:hypothetical protein [Niveispirillum sp.]